MKTLRLILGDQLSRSISSLQDINPEQDVILIVEIRDETRYVPHHPQKIILILSAMRHFAATLRTQGLQVDYIQLDAPGNTGSFTGELGRAITRHQPDQIIVTEPGEWRVWEMMRSWEVTYHLPVTILEDDRFLCSHREFDKWAGERKTYRMEFFYRHMRRKTDWLMQGDNPEGGVWNYDDQNRKALPRTIQLPPPLRFAPDTITAEVITLVKRTFSNHFGDPEPFGWAVSRPQALQALAHFIHHHLPNFGDYQDAMKTGEDFLFHSTLSPYLNIGLLNPREVCEAALNAWETGAAPLASVEGFIRQILGWREFVRGIYWREMPTYAATNHFYAQRPLPAFYWTGETEMRCLRETINATRRNAYAHHIQRLMITGNFALLAGINPAQVEEWYLSVYADAFEWVELPNTHGMSLHADGGLLASKPYAASGAYIHRMSDYCTGCAYNPKIKLGQGACPFNYLYWYFLIANQSQLGANPRMAMPYRNLARMTPEQTQAILTAAEAFLSGLPPSSY